MDTIDIKKNIAKMDRLIGSAGDTAKNLRRVKIRSQLMKMLPESKKAQMVGTGKSISLSEMKKEMSRLVVGGEYMDQSGAGVVINSTVSSAPVTAIPTGQLKQTGFARKGLLA